MGRIKNDWLGRGTRDSLMRDIRWAKANDHFFYDGMFKNQSRESLLLIAGVPFVRASVTRRYSDGIRRTHYAFYKINPDTLELTYSHHGDSKGNKE